MVATYSPKFRPAWRLGLANSGQTLDLSHPDEMSAEAVIHLQAAEPGNIAPLLSRLTSRLNGGSEPQVTVSEAADGLWFRSLTWQPILVARVEDALDDLLGMSWSGRYMWA
jgi:hypothetical protein